MLLRDVPPEKRRGLRTIQLLVARPSKNLSKLVAEFEPRLPRFFRHLTRSLGSRETSTPDLLSLLAFDPDYLSTLMRIGEADAAARADEIRTLLGVESRELTVEGHEQSGVVGTVERRRS